ncbi:hypothetical protein C8F01DRAFT_385490 [Mycena amicta]|nr:hypothetical protein C8F01DRAFT_385490 [Mycena amicta]
MHYHLDPTHLQSSLNMSYVQKLHNWLQGKNPSQIHLLSWAETAAGPSNARFWTMDCKIDGVSRGSATATTKSAAKEVAAKQACEVLGVPV